MLGLDIFQLLIFALAFIVTGVSKSGFAGGLGVITVPFLSVFISPLTAVALMLPTLILMDVMSVRSWWGHYDKNALKLLVLPGVAGVLIGYFAFNAINLEQVKLILGVITLIFGLNGFFSNRIKAACSKGTGVLLGTCAGFTSFVAHAGGPPLNFYLLSLNHKKATYLGTAVIFFAAINLTKVVPYFMVDLFTKENVLLALAFSPISFLGIKLGVWLQRTINEAAFFKFIYLLLIVLGTHLIWVGSI